MHYIVIYCTSNYSNFFFFFLPKYVAPAIPVRLIILYVHHIAWVNNCSNRNRKNKFPGWPRYNVLLCFMWFSSIKVPLLLGRLLLKLCAFTQERKAHWINKWQGLHRQKIPENLLHSLFHPWKRPLFVSAVGSWMYEFSAERCLWHANLHKKSFFAGLTLTFSLKD